MRATTLGMWYVSRAIRAVRMLVLSPLVTAARASACSAPAFSRSSRSKPEPTMQGPSQPFRRLKARAFLSTTATVCPSAVRERARPEPTRPHPTTTTCMPQCNTPGRTVQSRTQEAGGLLLLWGRGHAHRLDRHLDRRTAGHVTARHPRAGGFRHAPVTVPGGRPGIDSRDAALPPEEQVARTAARHRTAGDGAPAQANCLGSAGPGLHFVLGLRHRGDAHPAGAL